MRRLILALLWCLLSLASDREALIRAIAENPGDDAPRLVFADWLDENGDPHRAEFIRIQVRMATLPQDSGELVDLDRRMRELLKEHEDQWIPAGLKKYVGREGKPLFWERGFLGYLTLRTSALHSEEAHRALDGIELLAGIHLMLPNDPTERLESIIGLAQTNFIKRVRSVGFGGGTTDREFISILRLLKNCRHLSPPEDLTLEGIRGLSRASLAQQITSLDFQVSSLGNNLDAALREIISTGHFSALEELTLPSRLNYSLRPLIDANRLPSLKHLSIVIEGDLETRMNELEELIRTPGFSKLRSLKVGINVVGALEPRARLRAQQLINLLSKTDHQLALLNIDRATTLPTSLKAKLEANRQSGSCWDFIRRLSTY